MDLLGNRHICLARDFLSKLLSRYQLTIKIDITFFSHPFPCSNLLVHHSPILFCSILLKPPILELFFILGFPATKRLNMVFELIIRDLWHLRCFQSMTSFHKFHHALRPFKCISFANVKSTQNILEALPIQRLWCLHSDWSVLGQFLSFVRTEKSEFEGGGEIGFVGSLSPSFVSEPDKAEVSSVRNKTRSGLTDVTI